jgi:hypothetical protein
MATYYELVVKGDDRDLIPYLTGFATGAGFEGIFYAEESGLHVQALRERIRHHGEVQHVLCRENACTLVRDALAKAAPRYRFEIKDERAIASATFNFEVDTPSRKIAELVRGAVARLPQGVRVSAFEPRESTDASAKGAEVYSPTHDYHFAARGNVAGDVAGVIALRHTLSAIDFVKCTEIDLHAT